MNTCTLSRLSFAAVSACVAAAVAFAAPPTTTPAAPAAPSSPAAPAQATPPAGKQGAAKSSDAAAPAPRMTDPWPLAVCIVSGEKLDAKAFTMIYDNPEDKVNNGREMKFCCKDCAAKFKKNPTVWFAKANEAIIAEQVKAYPMTTCVVTDEALEADSKVVVVGNRAFKICCMKCQGAIAKNFDKYATKLDAAAKAKK